MLKQVTSPVMHDIVQEESTTSAYPPSVIALHWIWQPPDLRRGGAWFKSRVKSLRRAAATQSDPDVCVQEGLTLLQLHRQNYGLDGPKQLVMLW